MPSRKRQARKPSRVFQISYELGLLLALLIFALAPIHQAATRHANVIQILDDRHVATSASGLEDLTPGDEFPVYRFNPGALSEIGYATVDRLESGRIIFGFDPGRFHFAMGRQGEVLEVKDGMVRVNMGSDQGLSPRDSLIIFRDRGAIGRIRLETVEPQASWGQITGQSSAIVPGLTASEYVVATQIVVFKNAAIRGVEIGSILVLLIGYVAFWGRFNRSPLMDIGPATDRAKAALTRPLPRFIVNLVLAVPVVWFTTQFVVIAGRWAVGKLLVLASHLLPFSIPEPIRRYGALFDFLDRNILALYVLGGIVYFGVLIARKTSPALLAWKGMGFRGGPLKILPQGGARDATTWMLHLVIAYFFAYSVLNFIQGNLADMLAVGWGGSGIEMRGGFDLTDASATLAFFASALSAVGFMLTHLPHFSTAEDAFIVLRDFIFTLTILACLAGYCHSILGYLWGKRIRNLDFTIPGWITNAWCYGPLLGVVMLEIAQRMQPSGPTAGVQGIVGLDPVFGSGSFRYLDLSLELLLNVIYFATILNLGTMFGVMTDKGVRTTGFYSVVRHPSYTAEALLFLAINLRAFTTGYQWLAAAIVFLVSYWLRSEREDNFMSVSNPEYEGYRAATPYKFIPGIY